MFCDAPILNNTDRFGRVPVRVGQTHVGDHVRTLFDSEVPKDNNNDSFIKCLEKVQFDGPGIRFVVLGMELLLSVLGLKT